MAESKPPRDLPQVPDSVDPAIRRPLARVIEEVQRLLEFRGDPLDAALTTRKAIARGMLDSVGRALTGNVTYVNTFPTTSGGGGTTPDLTPPPTVTGLTVVAGFTQVIVQFDAPVYTQGHGNLQTNIYASRKDTTDPTMPTFGDAVLVFSAPGALNVVSIPSELNTRWHVWAKYKTVDGVESVTAAGGVNGYNVAGAFPTTGQDITQLLDVLTGNIREGQLYAALAEPIRSIIRRADDAAEDALRGALGTHQATKRAVAGLLTEAAQRGTSIAQTQVLIAEGDSQLAAQISLLQATVNNPATGVDATAAALDVVETLVNNGTTGVTALASRTSTLEARVTTPSTNPGNPAYNVTAAGLATEQSVRASLDGSVQALYTVRTELSSAGNRVIGGFGLSGTATATEGPRIDFGVRADRFYVAAPGDGSAPGIPDSLPFIIQATPTTINGVAVPAGTYIRDAFILNGSITNAKIGNAAIDDAKVANLSAAKITFGVMSGDRIDVNTLQANRLQVWSLAATQAIIADLSVDTFKIANQAVTVSSGAELTADVALSSTATTILSTTLNTGGAPLKIEALLWFVKTLVGPPSPNSRTVWVEINGTAVKTLDATRLELAPLTINTLIGSPGSGVLTVRVRATDIHDGYVLGDGTGYLYCLGTKK